MGFPKGCPLTEEARKRLGIHSCGECVKSRIAERVGCKWFEGYKRAFSSTHSL